MIGEMFSFHIPQAEQSDLYTVRKVEIEAVERAFENRFESRVMGVENRDWINSASLNQSFTEEEVCACWVCGGRGSGAIRLRSTPTALAWP